MSPILSLPTTLASSPVTPVVALDPNSAAQSASAMSQHILGTGGVIFAVVAIVSVAGYFYHGRGSTNSARQTTTGTWASLRSFLSSVCPRRLAMTSTVAASNWPTDLEVGLEQHVSMVYARFFHPTSWNVVECQPATVFAPGICVEDEAEEIPVSEPTPFGLNSFLDMDDDDDEDREDKTKRADENDNGAKPRVQRVPPYDTSSPTNVNFSSCIIGTTIRSGAFLSVPRHEDDSCEIKSSAFEEDSICSPYGGTSTTPTGLSNDTSESSISDCKLDLGCSPYDGILMTPPGSCDNLSLVLSEAQLAFTCSPCDGMVSVSPRFSPSSRRYGMPDMTNLTRTLKIAVSEVGLGRDLVSTTSTSTSLCDVSEIREASSAMSSGPLERPELMDKKPMNVNSDIGVHDSCDSFPKGPSIADISVTPHEGLDLMRKLLDVLRDRNVDCTPRALSEDSDSECNENDQDEANDSQITLGSTDRPSPESASPTASTNSDLSDRGPIYPLTPLSKFAMTVIPKFHISSPVAPWFTAEVQVVSPGSLPSPPSLSSKRHVRTHRYNRALLYSPRSPLVVPLRF